MARTKAKDHADKRGLIQNVAAEVFARDGFDRASMNQIAAACGISKANIYHYYPSKDALLFDLLESYLKELRDRVLASDDPSMPAEDRLRRAVREVLKAYQGADNHHRVLVAGLSPLPEQEQRILRDYQRGLVGLISDILGDVAPTLAGDKVRLRATTMSVFAMTNWYFMWNADADPEAREEYADVVAALTLGGVGRL